MRVGGRRTTKRISDPSTSRGIGSGPLVSRVLMWAGLFFLVASLAFAGHSFLRDWLVGQDHYLVAGEAAPVPVVTMSWMALARSSPTSWPTTTPWPTDTAPAAMTSVPNLTLSPSVTPFLASTGTAALVLGDSPVPPHVSVATAPPPATATPVPTPGSLAPPARIQIPSLDINRSIVPLARKTEPGTGVQTWNTKKLFRSGPKDRVGYSEASAFPGEEGNIILVGHNSGNGRSGVFARLKRLKLGHRVQVMNSAGEIFVYEVKTIEKLSLRRATSAELDQHLSFLSVGDSEHLTLVGCSGAGAEFCQERIYVVAEPAE